MPPRSEEEKLRRKLLHKKKQEARKLAKEKKKEEKAQQKAVVSINTNSDKASTDDAKIKSTEECMFLTVPEDALRRVMCFLTARDLGVISMCSRYFNFGMAETKISHFFSRMCYVESNRKSPIDPWKMNVPIRMCANEAEARILIMNSLEGSENTGRLITKKSKRALNKRTVGDADEYIAYARFLEEAVSGYSIQKYSGKKASNLPPVVNGRFASVSPEHSLCRVGGDGNKSGAGGSGCASWGCGKRGQLGHGKRKDEKRPKRLLGGIGYGIRIVQVSAGGGLVRVSHSLLLTSTGRVLSFGNGQYGQLGHGYSPGKQLPDMLHPHYVEELSHLQCICVSAGELHSAVVTSDGDLYTWGDGFCGQLGLGDKRPKLTPQQVTDGGLEDECILTVNCGARHTLCLSEDGEVFSFGLGHFGVLGRAYTPYQYYCDSMISNLGENGEELNLTPTNLVSSQIEGITDNMAYNLNLLANLTLDDKSDQCIPKVIDSLQGIFIVGASAGHRHSIFLDAKGGVYTCGVGAGGALGHGNHLKEEYPMKIMKFVNENTSIIQISAGVDISMAVSSTGDVYAWGKTFGGRIGLNVPDADHITSPTEVLVEDSNEKLFRAVDVECGYVHSLIVGCDGTLYMCGGVGTDGADDGQLLEANSVSNRPYKVSDFNIWHRIPEPIEVKESANWKKYGKYELKGRSAMMAEKEKWGS